MHSKSVSHRILCPRYIVIRMMPQIEMGQERKTDEDRQTDGLTDREEKLEARRGLKISPKKNKKIQRLDLQTLQKP